MQLVYYGDSLEHHGVKGQKWGRRRYQNADGSLTSAGKNHYGSGSTNTIKTNRDSKKLAKALQKHSKAVLERERDVKRYFNPETGHTIEVANKKLSEKALKTKKVYEKLKTKMQKKYASVESTSKVDIENGQIKVNVLLKKIGKSSSSDLRQFAYEG